MEDVVVPIVAILGIFVGLPWVVLHYFTRLKTAATLTTGDEALLDELYQLARRLDERSDRLDKALPSVVERHRIGLDRLATRLDHAVWSDGRTCAPGSVGACL